MSPGPALRDLAVRAWQDEGDQAGARLRPGTEWFVRFVTGKTRSGTCPGFPSLSFQVSLEKRRAESRRPGESTDSGKIPARTSKMIERVGIVVASQMPKRWEL